MILRSLFAAAVLAAAFAVPASAEPTEITVRVISKGAKFIGSSMGGVDVVIRDASTMQILATGKTQGATGDTDRIMKTEHGRLGVLASEDAAAFTATLDLKAPRLIHVTATGPNAEPQSANTVTATQWVMPGKDIAAGNGFLLEMPGLVVDVVDPPVQADGSVELAAKVQMMCGCPLTPGGLWDADAFEIAAIVTKDGREVARLPLAYAGEASRFAGRFAPPAPGAYVATVYGYQPATGNTGVAFVSFTVE